MRRETPEGIFFLADLAHAEAVGVDVLDASESLLRGKLLNLQDGGMIAQQMAHHEKAIRPAGSLDHFRAFAPRQGERFLGKHVFAGAQGGEGHAAMFLGGRSQDHGIHVGVGDGIFQAGIGLGAGIELAEGLQPRGMAFADGVQVAEGGEITGQVLAPVSAAGDADVGFLRGRTSNGGHGFAECLG